MKKKDLLKYLNVPAKNVPPHIIEIFDEYGLQLINNEFNTWGLWYDGLYKRVFEVYPNEGLAWIRDFFNDFNKQLETIKTDGSQTRKIENLQKLKKVLEYFKPVWDNEIIELELIRHRPYLDDYILKIDYELNLYSPQQTETKTDKLKVPQIALIHVYEGIQITRENAGEIATKHGYTAKNSGEGLFQDYINYCSKANRKGKPTLCTPKKLKNKIELFESVVNHLSDNSKQRAIDEIKILKIIFENEYQ